MSQTKSINFIKAFSFPIILYLVFIAVRFQGLQPETESELGDMITALNFLFGAFISYFVFILYTLELKETPKISPLWWWCTSALLTLLAFDELFMIHEQLGAHFEIKDTLIFLIYGAALGILLLCQLKETFTRNTFSFLVLFAICSVVSQASDYLYNEGTMIVMGREISYEQLLESLGAMFLSCAITTIGLRRLYN